MNLIFKRQFFASFDRDLGNEQCKIRLDEFQTSLDDDNKTTIYEMNFCSHAFFSFLKLEKF